MVSATSDPVAGRALRAIDLAREAEISTQQVRNYLDAGLLPAAGRTATGYRILTEAHLAALRTVRTMAPGFGWTVTSAVMRALHDGDPATALALIDASQAELHHERQQLAATLVALEALLTTPTDVLIRTRRPVRIGAAAEQVGVRASALRVWESWGLLRPARSAVTGYREYAATDLRDAHTVALLRRGGYRLDAIMTVLDELRRGGSPARAQAALAKRQDDLTQRSEQRLAAAAALYHYLQRLRAEEWPT